MIKCISKCDWKQSRKQYEGGPNHEGYERKPLMGEMLELDGGIAVILMQAGMHCVGCPSSIGESLEEACMVHGLDADVVLANINEYLSSKNA